MNSPAAPRRAITLALALPLATLLTLSTPPRGVAQQPPAPPTAVSAPGTGPVYNVEIIVFRAAGAVGGAENWSAEAGGGARSIAGEESGGGSQVGHFVGEIPASAWQLGELESRLRASGSYVPVAHAAWSQSASSWGTRAGFTLQRLGISVPGLSGTVYLEHGQYLHLGMSLSFEDPSPPAGLGAAPGTTFTINESRRVKYYERNYFDNPAFGVIALVTPVQGTRAPGR